MNHLSNMDTALLERRALEYGKARKFDKAQEIWAQVRELRPGYAQAYIGAIDLCLEHRKYRQAEDLCLEGINRCAGPNLKLLERLAEVKTRQLKYAEALQRWAEVRRLFPHIESGYKKAAMIYRDMDKYDLAEDMCLKGIDKCSQKLGLYQFYANLAREGGGRTEVEKLKELLKRRQEICRQFPGNLEEMVKLAHTCNELAKYEPQYSSEYNRIVSSLLQGYAGKNEINNKKSRPRLCVFCISLQAIRYYKPFIKYICPSLIDLVVKYKNANDSKILKAHGLESYNVIYGMENLKKYDYVIISESGYEVLEGITANFITLHHVIECIISESLIERSVLFIYELEHESGNEPTLEFSAFDSGNKELYSQLPVEAKCEITHTGMYHLDEFIPDPEYKRIYRRKLAEHYGQLLDEEKPLVVYMEDTTAHFGQTVYCLNRLCHVANIILKPWGGLDRPAMARLDPRIIVYRGGGVVHNNLRYSADFIMAGYRSGSLMSSLLLGIPVIPYYSRIEFHNNIGTGGMILEQAKYIRDSDPRWAMHKRIRKFIRLFDLLKPQEIMTAVTGGEYIEWYRKILPRLRKEAMGDYARTEGGYALRRTAEYIMRFASEGTLGEDCQAVYLKKKYFSFNDNTNVQV